MISVSFVFWHLAKYGNCLLAFPLSLVLDDISNLDGVHIAITVQYDCNAQPVAKADAKRNAI